VAVRYIGEEINGAYRWVQVGGVSFQPAELIKFRLMIWAADLLARRKSEGKLSDFNLTIKPLLIALGAVGFAVGIMQSDFGSTTVMAGMLGAMMFIAGVPLENLTKIGLVVLIGTAILILPSGYRRDRVMTFM